MLATPEIHPLPGGYSEGPRRKGHLTVHRNETATLTVLVSPATARCSISVIYKTGPSAAKGLGKQRPTAGKISWSWKVDGITTPGRWPIEINCGNAGSLKTSFVVRR
jgi:hypothetical protein